MENGITPVMNVGGSNGFTGDNSFIFLFAILALLWGGNGGLFGNRNNAFPQDYARQSDVVYTSAFNQLQDENANIISAIGNARNDTITALKDSAYNNLSEIRDLETSVNAGFSNLQNCC
jgi:hypothetical protein